MAGRYGSKKIAFQLTACVKCGADRQLGLPCENCGSKPRGTEVDGRLVVRRQRIEKFEQEYRGALVQTAVMDWDDVELQIFTAVTAAREALLGLLSGKVTPRECVNGFQGLREIEAALSMPQPRPYVNERRAHHESTKLALRSLLLSIQASRMARIPDAQAEVDRAQRAMDAALSALDEATVWRETRCNLGRISSPIEGASSAMAIRAGGGPNALRELSASGQGPRDLASAAIELLGESFAGSFFDLQEYERVRCEAVHILRQGDLSELFADPEWVGEFKNFLQKSLMHARSVARVHSDPSATNLDIVDVWFSVIKGIRESRLRFLLSAMLRINGVSVSVGGFGRGDTAGSLIAKAARKWPNLGLDEALSEDMRKFAAHDDYRVVGDVVVVDRGGQDGPRELSFSAFQDACLHHLELVSALEIGLVSTLAKNGAIPEMGHAVQGQVLESAIIFFFSVAGLNVESVDLDGAEITVRVDGASAVEDDATWASLAAGTADLVVEATSLLRVDTGEGVVEADLEPFREPEGGDDPSGRLAYYEALAAVQVNGVMAQPRGATWSDVVDRLSRGASVADAGEAVRYLRQLKALGLRAEVSGEVLGRLDSQLARVREGKWAGHASLLTSVPAAFRKA